MAKKATLTYNEAVRELEEIVAAMQDENCDIDKLATMARRAKVLVKLCRDKLTNVADDLESQG